MPTIRGTKPGRQRARRTPVLVLLVAAFFTGRSAHAEAISADKLPELPLADRAGGAEGEFLRALHAHVHRRWTDNFLRLAAEQLPQSNPVNNPALAAEADLVIGPDGQLLSVKVARSSGVAGFDDAVTDILRDAAPYPIPPSLVRSDDGNAHLHWAFARDDRRCSGIALGRVYDPVDVSVPRLLQHGERTEALRRLAMARQEGVHAEPMFSMLALDWIKAALRDPAAASVKQALTIAGREHGNTDVINWLKSALRRPELAGEAGPALVTLGVPVCPMIKGWFETRNPTDQDAAARALATSSDAACAAGLASLLANGKARPEARIAAAVALGAIDTDDARNALASVAKNEAEKSAVRAAAILAQIRAGAGRVKVIAMERYIRDPDPELRATAAAGVVRAGGDANLADLYVLFKESDPRPGVAAIRELERLHTEESTKLIARLAKRPQIPVAKAALEVLIRRKATELYSTTMKSYLDPDADPALRALALVAADEPTLQAATADPKLGTAVFRARLARGERDQAADWLLAHRDALTPAQLGDCMADWVATGSGGAASATATASK